MWKYQFYGPHGLCRLESDQYPDLNVIKKIAEGGFRVTGMHVGGDRAIDQLFDVMDKLVAEYPDIPGRRWAIDHCEAVHADQIQRAKKLGVMFSCAPGYLYNGDRGAVGAFKEIFKDEAKAANAVIPLRSMIDAGLRPVIELDAHAFHPMTALQVFISRKDNTGKVWAPQQAITRQEALYAYTRWAAEYFLREKAMGSIEPRKLADFVVLDRDYLTVPEAEIGRIDAVLTVVDGKIVYSEPGFATSQDLPTVGYQGDRSRWNRGVPNAAQRAPGGGAGE
jgi:predicted amidohydrolase YtcJ